MDCLIVGAGPAGLGVASTLAETHPQARIVLLEAGNQTGGKIRTLHDNGWTVETGAITMRTAHHSVVEWLNHLGLTPLKPSAAASKRYVYHRGTLHSVPWGVLGLLGYAGTWRALQEWRKPARVIPEESVADFFERRFGKAVADVLASAFVGGIYAGSPRELAVGAAFPALQQAEAEYGSLTRYLFTRPRTPKPTVQWPPIVSFAGGMSSLIQALERPIPPESVYLESAPRRITWQDGHWLVDTNTHRWNAHELVWAAPPEAWNALDPVPNAVVTTLPTPPVTVWHLGFEASAFPETPRGFGFLVPETERELDILGCQFVSSIFPERAPAGKVLLSVFMGGSRAPHLATQPDETVLHILARDLDRVLGVRQAPVWVYRVDWPGAIPQYTAAAFTLHRQLDELEKHYPSLHFTGNYRSGISLPDTLLHGRNLGLQIGAKLATQPRRTAP